MSILDSGKTSMSCKYIISNFISLSCVNMKKVIACHQFRNVNWERIVHIPYGMSQDSYIVGNFFTNMKKSPGLVHATVYIELPLLF